MANHEFSSSVEQARTDNIEELKLTIERLDLSIDELVALKDFLASRLSAKRAGESAAGDPYDNKVNP